MSWTTYNRNIHMCVCLCVQSNDIGSDDDLLNSGLCVLGAGTNENKCINMKILAKRINEPGIQESNACIVIFKENAAR